MISIIYKYTSPSGKVYIGQTTNETRRRKTFLNLNKSYGGKKIDNARQKYGPSNFKYEVIHTIDANSKVDATQKLDELEEYYIDQYSSYREGYNMTFGGYTNRGFKYSDEQKKQMSLSRLGKKGTALTEAQKFHHSSLMKLKWQTSEYRDIREAITKSPEHIQKRKNSATGAKNGMYGKTHALESKQKMSESRFGEKNYWFGKEKPSSTKEKISSAMTKYHNEHIVSDETRKKISQHCSTSVAQYSLNGEYINTFDSITNAGKILGIDNSCITKCCKRIRASAGGFKWQYSDSTTNSNVITGKLEVDEEWITTLEAVKLTGRCRNVLYYHIKEHNIPKISIGRKIKINKKALIELFNKNR